jgi:hypothetical protein
VGKVQLVVDKCRVDGTQVRLAEVEVGDETGTVSLRARDEQIDLLTRLSEAQGVVVLRNCTLELYQGKHIRLAITKWGKMSPFPDTVASTPPPPSKINRDRNFSLIDLSVVASELAPYGNDQYEGEGAGGGGLGSGTSQSRTHSHNASHMSGRGRGRKPMHGSSAHVPQPIHYPSNLAYPGGLHGYGFSAMEGPHYPHVRSPPHHHHHHHHHRTPNATANAPSIVNNSNPSNTNNPPLMVQASHYNMHHQRPAHIPYRSEPLSQLATGMGFHTSIASMSVSGSGGNSNSAHMLSEGSFPETPSQQQQQQQQQGRMNPQAATFDPKYGRAPPH